MVKTKWQLKKEYKKKWEGVKKKNINISIDYVVFYIHLCKSIHTPMKKNTTYRPKKEQYKKGYA
jgi:hypothetical protein